MLLTNAKTKAGLLAKAVTKALLLASATQKFESAAIRTNWSAYNTLVDSGNAPKATVVRVEGSTMLVKPEQR
jgi:hypothetical protein